MSVGCSGSSLYGFGGRAGFSNSCFGLREAETGDGTEKRKPMPERGKNSKGTTMLPEK